MADDKAFEVAKAFLAQLQYAPRSMGDNPIEICIAVPDVMKILQQQEGAGVLDALEAIGIKPYPEGGKEADVQYQDAKGQPASQHDYAYLKVKDEGMQKLLDAGIKNPVLEAISGRQPAAKRHLS